MLYLDKSKIRQFFFMSFVILAAGHTSAESFDSCPTEAFLIQGGVALMYGVNLATGSYQELSNDLATTGKINAIGYSYHDNYIYGFGYEFDTVVKIGNDFQATALSVNGLPDTSFYVGDVSLEENSYFVYRRGATYGLYEISLDETSAQYLQAQKIIDGASLDLQIYDFAFHPENGLLYSVNAGGNLVTIDPQTGESNNVTNVGETGTFGAVYFDVDRNLYISRNNDGHIFRVNTDDELPVAEFFAFGPSSTNNDGARCGLAPIVTEDSTVDFGSAPDSYGTSIESNGARHEASLDLFLGDSLGEDDGINFVTGFETGLDTLINVTAHGEGYLNMWVDWDQDGSFDSDEQVVVDKVTQEGLNPILIAVPIDAATGDTWTRVRYSSTPQIGPTGGVSDGEVEDQVITVTPSGISVVSYPGSNAYVSLAFEDNWPELGDYDLNDVVMAYRTKQYIDENQRVVRYDIEGRVLAVGAGYHNGFAVQLDGVRTDNIAKDLVRFKINDSEQGVSPIEDNLASDDAVIVIFDDLWSRLETGAGCEYYRTEDACQESQALYFSVTVPLVNSLEEESSPHSTLNPFIFASPGHYHGDVFAEPPGRSLEIHLKNKKASAKFNQDLFNTYDDNSNGIADTSFLSLNNMPWAIEVPILWDHPKERVDILNAYPQFSTFVETGGLDNPTWYLNANANRNRVIRN